MNKSVLSDAQIEKGRESIFSTDNPYCPCDRKTMLKAARWAEQAVLQSPEIQQLRKDAERYRWLRDNSVLYSEFSADDTSGWAVMRRDSGKRRVFSYADKDLDIAIDTAVALSKSAMEVKP